MHYGNIGFILSRTALTEKWSLNIQKQHMLGFPDAFFDVFMNLSQHTQASVFYEVSAEAVGVAGDNYHLLSCRTEREARRATTQIGFA